jgi:1-acyl-sn-glycerol-3-phosphate acyltransferase
MSSPTEISERFFDLEQLFATKNPGLFRMLPGFVFSYLKKITHQEEINGYIFKHRDKYGLAFIDAMLNEFGVRTEISIPALPIETPGFTNSPTHQFTNLPVHQLNRLISPKGRYIIASNHPLGGMDGMALMQEIGKVRSDIVFPVNDLLMNIPGLQPLFIPINKHGKNTENISVIDQTFASGKVILYFPAGLVSRKQKGGIIKDLEWKKTFISKAKKYQRDIIPVFINGQNSSFFYNLSLWRSRFGIKVNLEMLYLVDEMIKQKGKTLKMTIGEPIPYTAFDKSKTDTQWADFVKERVYSLL